MRASRSTRTTNTSSRQLEDLFQPLGFLSSFGRVWTIYRRLGCWLLGTCMLSASIWYCVSWAIYVLMQALSARHKEVEQVEIDGEEYTYETEVFKITIMRIGACLQMLAYYLLQLPADAINIRMIAEYYTGYKPAFAESMSCGLSKFLSLIFASYSWSVLLLVPVLGLIFWSAPEDNVEDDFDFISTVPYNPKVIGGSIYALYSTFFLLVTYLIYPSIVVEERGAMASFGRSMELVRGRRFLQAWAILLVWFILRVLLTKGVAAALLLTELDKPSDAVTFLTWLTSPAEIFVHPVEILWSVNGVMSNHWGHILVGMFLASISAVVQAILYIDFRVKEEDFTHEELCGELGLAPDKGSYLHMEAAPVVNRPVYRRPIV